MNLYEAGQDEEGESEPVSMTYEEYLEYKEMLEAQIERAEAARKLAQNPDFQIVVMQELFVNEPRRIGELMASGKLPPKSFESCTQNLQSIGFLRSFLTEQLEKGQLAQSQLESLEAGYQEAVESGAMSTSKMI